MSVLEVFRSSSNLFLTRFSSFVDSLTLFFSDSSKSFKTQVWILKFATYNKIRLHRLRSPSQYYKHSINHQWTTLIVLTSFFRLLFTSWRLVVWDRLLLQACRINLRQTFFASSISLIEVKLNIWLGFNMLLVLLSIWFVHFGSSSSCSLLKLW